MTLSVSSLRAKEIVYPESDGEPMAENTLQFQWIMTIVGGLRVAFRDRSDVLIVGDLFWYPVQGDPRTRVAPDAMVVFGRPNGHRRSYLQWEEGGIAPQVVFEVVSPGNRAVELMRKHAFYERFGAQEYYVIDPDEVSLEGWSREGNALVPIQEMNGWTSPLLGMRFSIEIEKLILSGPDGRPFVTYEELADQLDAAALERDAAALERDAERQRADRLAAKLRELGLELEDT